MTEKRKNRLSVRNTDLKQSIKYCNDKRDNIYICHPELDSGSPLLSGQADSDVLFRRYSGDAETSSA